MATTSKIYRNKFYNCAKKFGIVLRFLKQPHREFLRKNDFVKFISDNDTALHILFKIDEMEADNRWKRKLYYDEDNDKVCPIESLNVSSRIFDWKCATCGSPIKVKMENTIAKFFLCEKCLPVYWKSRGKVDRRIVDSSIEFNKMCRKLLKKKQKNFMKHLETSSKIS